MTYNKRIFGAAIVKAINSNYNADFSGQPRTLPNGTVYATDKAFKYTVKNYLKDVYADEKSEEKQATTLGRQSKLQEGHYLHHFSVNPQNLEEIVKLAGDGAQSLSDKDIEKLQEAMRLGVTWYDSASKTGSEMKL